EAIAQPVRFVWDEPYVCLLCCPDEVALEHGRQQVHALAEHPGCGSEFFETVANRVLGTAQKERSSCSIDTPPLRHDLLQPPPLPKGALIENLEAPGREPGHRRLPGPSARQRTRLDIRYDVHPPDAIDARQLLGQLGADSDVDVYRPRQRRFVAAYHG